MSILIFGYKSVWFVSISCELDNPYYHNLEGKIKSSANNSTSTNSNRFVDYSVYVEDLEKTEIIGLIQQRQIPVKSDLPVTHTSVMKIALR